MSSRIHAPGASGSFKADDGIFSIIGILFCLVFRLILEHSGITLLTSRFVKVVHARGLWVDALTKSSLIGCIAGCTGEMARTQRLSAAYAQAAVLCEAPCGRRRVTRESCAGDGARSNLPDMFCAHTGDECDPLADSRSARRGDAGLEIFANNPEFFEINPPQWTRNYQSLYFLKFLTSSSNDFGAYFSKSSSSTKT